MRKLKSKYIPIFSTLFRQIYPVNPTHKKQIFFGLFQNNIQLITQLIKIL